MNRGFIFIVNIIHLSVLRLIEPKYFYFTRCNLVTSALILLGLFIFSLTGLDVTECKEK